MRLNLDLTLVHFIILVFAGVCSQRRSPRARRSQEDIGANQLTRHIRREVFWYPFLKSPVMWLPTSARGHARNLIERSYGTDCKSGNIWRCQPGVPFAVACSVIIGCSALFFIYIQTRPADVSRPRLISLRFLARLLIVAETVLVAKSTAILVSIKE